MSRDYAVNGGFVSEAGTRSYASVLGFINETVTVTPPTPEPQVVVRRPGAEDPREEFERRQQEDRESRQRIIDRAWRLAHGETDPEPTQEESPPTTPADLTKIKAVLAGKTEQDQQAAADQGNLAARAANAIDAIETQRAQQIAAAAEAQRQEDDAIALLLLAV
jgi:hypothetical protein